MTTLSPPSSRRLSARLNSLCSPLAPSRSSLLHAPRSSTLHAPPHLLQGVNEEKTLKSAFKKFDTDGSGEVSFGEFLRAMEGFGLQCPKPGARGKGGVPPEVMRGLFDRYNKDLSECISYKEFSDGLFTAEKEAANEENDGGKNEQGGQNPWLPTLANTVSMDPNFHRPNTAQRVRSIANPRKNQFTLD